MTIQISIKARDEHSILEKGMEYINQSVKDTLQWNKDKIYNYYQTECDIPEENILPLFNELIKKYPSLDIFALYSYSIREEDRSAQWWVTTTIKTEHHPDGTTTLSTDSNTNWF